jgi:hypothetical protein
MVPTEVALGLLMAIAVFWANGVEVMLNDNPRIRDK